MHRYTIFDQSHRINRDIAFHEETHKGENLFFLGCQSSSNFHVHHSFELRLKYEATTSDRKLQLAESTNSQISLAPTRWKHQLPGFSSTHQMEAPTPKISSRTNQNLEDCNPPQKHPTTLNESQKTLLTCSVSDMVCYSSMCPLPSSYSILCSTSSSSILYALLFFLLCSTPHVVQLLFFLLCYVFPLHPLYCAMDLPFRLCIASHPIHMHHAPIDTLSLLYSACISHIESFA